jgi:exosortase/archaeosortase family protein
MPIARVGTALSVPGLNVEVADNCSGWSSLQAAVITALVLAHFSTSPRRRLLILASAIPLAIVANVLRVTALVLLAQRYGGDLLDTTLHPASGVILFGVVIVAMFLIAGRDALHAAPPSGIRTPIATRFALPLALLCAFAAVPVAMHSSSRMRSDDCANPGALAPVEASADTERARYMETHYQASQWREGVLPATADAPELQWALVRSYEPRLLYYRGSRRLWLDVEPGGDTLEWLESDDGKLPIVRSRLSGERPEQPRAVIASLLVYEGEPVAEGWRAQLRAAPRQILTGSRPMTLYTVRGDVSDGNREATEKRARAFLVDSWRTYRALCRAQP